MKTIKSIGINLYIQENKKHSVYLVRKFFKNKQHIKVLGHVGLLTKAKAQTKALEFVTNLENNSNLETGALSYTLKDILKKYKEQRQVTKAQSTIMTENRLIDRYLKPLENQTMLSLDFNAWDKPFKDLFNRGKFPQFKKLRILAKSICDMYQVENPNYVNFPEQMNKRYRLPKGISQHMKACTTASSFAQIAYLLSSQAPQHHSLSIFILLKLQSLLMLRPANLRKLLWSEVDFKNNKIILPGNKCKAGSNSKLAEKIEKQEHWVPLSKQSKQLLLQQQKISGDFSNVFPSFKRSDNAAVSDTGSRNMLVTLNISDIQTLHGFRSSAATLLQGVMNYSKDLTELQLGHVTRDNNGEAYNREDYYFKRCEMMQDLADLYDTLAVLYKNNYNFDSSRLDYPEIKEKVRKQQCQQSNVILLSDKLKKQLA